MTVAEYLARHGLNPSQLARQIGVPRALVYRWVKGAPPRGRNLLLLVEGTHGEVSAEDALRASVSDALADDSVSDTLADESPVDAGDVEAAEGCRLAR